MFTIRDELLNLNKNKHLIIIGCGGIGSNLAVLAAIAGVSHITVIDNDDVEIHNLGRTFFSFDKINKPKVNAIEEIIKNLRPTSNTTNKDLFEIYQAIKGDIETTINLSKFLKKKNIPILHFNAIRNEITESTLKDAIKKYALVNDVVIVDCTDKFFSEKEVKDYTLDGVFLKLNYDGKDASIFFNPYKYNDKNEFNFPLLNSFDNDNGYQTTPSYLVPPIQLCLMALEIILSEEKVEETKLISFEVNSLYKSILNNPEYITKF